MKYNEKIRLLPFIKVILVKEELVGAGETGVRFQWNVFTSVTSEPREMG